MIDIYYYNHVSLSGFMIKKNPDSLCPDFKDLFIKLRLKVKGTAQEICHWQKEKLVEVLGVQNGIKLSFSAS
ncbi:MAG: hypothetical protein ABS46_14990 [Cytophagaceae bacterium SCN 52-12]|nr:MAG: hypothetical protein ABS46_14990 [Cytophagaceae bacterium SCN 52-12]